jgi:NDP-4-keto-2,6-dideoxyhexose 3-C-methyltransferase
MGELYQRTKHCRLCGSDNLRPLLDLGSQYVVDFVPSIDTSLLRAPLVLLKCGECRLVQLEHSVDKERLFRKFWYRSNVNEQMRAALRSVVGMAEAVADVKNGDTVLDIGANDGTLLGWYPGVVRTVGIDPCGELVEEGLKQKRMAIGIKTFFSKQAVQAYGPYKVITAIAMFYDLADPIAFLQECGEVLRKDGVLIVQMNYLTTMLENCAVDNVCHEHLTYFCMQTMKQAADRAGLECVGAEQNELNGGSFRVYMTHKDSGLYGIGTSQQLDLFLSMMNMLHREMKAETENIYGNFVDRVNVSTSIVRQYVEHLPKDRKLYMYGASTRGTVLLQLLNLPGNLVHGVAERDPNKYGLRMVGASWPEIFPEDKCRADATHFLVLPWHFRDSITERESNWMRHGGELLFPLPKPEAVTEGGKCRYLETREKVGA